MDDLPTRLRIDSYVLGIYILNCSQESKADTTNATVDIISVSLIASSIGTLLHCVRLKIPYTRWAYFHLKNYFIHKNQKTPKKKQKPKIIYNKIIFSVTKNSLRAAIEKLILLCFWIPIRVSWDLTWPYGKVLGFFQVRSNLSKARRPQLLHTRSFVVSPIWCNWIGKWFAIECLCKMLCRLFYGTGLISVVGVTTTQAAVGIQAIQMSTAVSQTVKFEPCKSMLRNFSTSRRRMILLQQFHVLLYGALLRWNDFIIKGFDFAEGWVLEWWLRKLSW